MCNLCLHSLCTLAPQNDISDVLDLTFSMDADEENQILYGKGEVSIGKDPRTQARHFLNPRTRLQGSTLSAPWENPMLDAQFSSSQFFVDVVFVWDCGGCQATDVELIPGGRNIRVTEENKQQYVDAVADYRMTGPIREQINAFLEGFNELVPRSLIGIFNDRELELLISGLPDIDGEHSKFTPSLHIHTPLPSPHSPFSPCSTSFPCSFYPLCCLGPACPGWDRICGQPVKDSPLQTQASQLPLLLGLTRGVLLVLTLPPPSLSLSPCNPVCVSPQWTTCGDTQSTRATPRSRRWFSGSGRWQQSSPRRTERGSFSLSQGPQRWARSLHSRRQPGVPLAAGPSPVGGGPSAW